MSVARKLLLVVALPMVATMALSSSALAHVDPDPVEAPAGSELSVGFTVQHGCTGSPTVELLMRLPEGVTNATPEAPPGWTGGLDGNVVSFNGGPLDPDTEETFRVRMTLPLTPGATIYFPFVQRCEVGEIAWIDVPADGSGTELDEPAPAMTLTAALPGTTQPSTTIAATTIQPAATATSVAAPTTTATTSTVESVTEPDPEPAESTKPALVTTTSASTDLQISNEEPEDGESSSGGTIVLVVTVVVIVAGGAAVLIRARRRR